MRLIFAGYHSKKGRIFSSVIMSTESPFNHRKYRPHRPFSKKDRCWPDRVTTVAPDFCSVDLRDGNQALRQPMDPNQKLEMFRLLLDVGFKEIEVGFPAASAPDFQFVRLLIEEGHIPEDVVIQVLTPARPALIERTFESLRGAKRAIVHLYNSTSTVQREEVFQMSRSEVKELAESGARCIRDEAAKQLATEFFYEYSPESFTGTEMDFAAEVCNAVINVWEPSADKKVIINLPATVEVSSPHVYADQIEWMSEQLIPREHVRLSLHTHNDRGSGIAAAELGLLAGADRIEGTLLGNGERTGNMDVVTFAMNLYSQGIDPTLDFSQMDRIVSTVERCTQLKVHERHPYAGELVFAAFSGSHQDAINKCLRVDEDRRTSDPLCEWHVAYLPIDPRDVGRSYQEVVRVNSQSGKGGVAFVLEREHRLRIPKWLQTDFAPHVQKMAEGTPGELTSAEMARLFFDTYEAAEHAATVLGYELKRRDGHDHLTVQFAQSKSALAGRGSGVLEAFVDAISRDSDKRISLVHYDEHSLGDNERAEAIAYVQVNVDGVLSPGVARSDDTILASLNAVRWAVLRAA